MLATTLHGAVKRFGDIDAVVAPDGQLSFRELERRSIDLAAGLRSRGVGEGDLVALLLPSGAEWMIAAVAIDRIGGIVAGVSPRLASTERAALVTMLQPKVTIASTSLTDGLPLRSSVLATRTGALGADIGDEGAHPADVDAPAAMRNDPARPSLVCCTSGTTGRPKGALFNVAQLRAISEIDVGPEFEDVWGGGAPMLASTEFAHIGMVGKLPWYIRLGATLVVMERWRPDDALQLVDRHRMPVLGVVAPQLALMLQSPRFDEFDLSCVRTVIAGGAPSPPALVLEATRRLGCDYSIRYSSTESGGVGLATPADADERQATRTIGRPRPGVEARVARDDGTDASVSEVGELQIRSAANMAGYWNQPDATDDTVTGDGWLRTGDLAVLDTTGCFTLAGRRTDMFIRGGYNVFPEEVEAVLGQHPAVAQVAVAPRPDDVLGEIGVAVVVPTSRTAPPTLDELREFGRHDLAHHKLPDAVIVVDDLPLTAASKMDRPALRVLVGAPPLHSEPPPAEGMV
ncbi:MAG: class I adenylate-forming enzyme family protein [Actinomycetes bacterium]